MQKNEVWIKSPTPIQPLRNAKKVCKKGMQKCMQKMRFAKWYAKNEVCKSKIEK
jgi:hypothetical protein